MAKPRIEKKFKITGISFEEKNSNCMVIQLEDGDRTYYSIPPGKRPRIDILTDIDLKEQGAYCVYDFKGMVIIIEEDKRMVYVDGMKMYEGK